MTTRRNYLVRVLLMVCGISASAMAAGAAQPKNPEDVVQAELERLGASQGRVSLLTDDALARAIPAYRWVSVILPQYPVARRPPVPLAASNLYAVGYSDGALFLLTSANELQQFAAQNLGPTVGASRCVDVMQAWLRLTQEFSADGYFEFSLDQNSLACVSKADGLIASGLINVVPQRGDLGHIQATLTFNNDGKLITVSEDRQVYAGARPICHATKLLDSDPVVRGMAVQGLVVMGRASKDYLDIHRATADAKLRQAIDAVWARIIAEGR